MSKYNPDGLTVRSADEIHEGIVNHPDNAGCRDQKDLLCTWRRAYERHMNEAGSAAWRAFQKKIDGEKSQSMRSLTVLAEREGDNKTVYHAHTDNFLTLKWMLNTMPQERRIDLAAAYAEKAKTEIRLPPPGPELSPIVYKGQEERLCRIYIKANAMKFYPQDPIERLLSGEMPEAPRWPSPAGPKLH